MPAQNQSAGALIALVGAGIALVSFFFLALIDLSDFAGLSGLSVDASGMNWTLHALHIQSAAEAFGLPDFGTDFSTGSDEYIDGYHAALGFVPAAGAIAVLAVIQTMGSARSSEETWSSVIGFGILGLLYLGYFYLDIDNILDIPEGFGISGTDFIGVGFWAMLGGAGLTVLGAFMARSQSRMSNYPPYQQPPQYRY
jgi:hypothetical protein